MIGAPCPAMPSHRIVPLGIVRSVIASMLNADMDLEVIGEAATFAETLN
jgi:hypothetical protein